MPRIVRKKLGTITVVYWVLLLYTITALVWWFISLMQQNKMMTDFRISQLNYTINRSTDPEHYKNELKKINKIHQRNSVKYISEGSIFFLVILVGAAFVYRAVRREFNVQQQQQNFLMAVTHELKTPISVARLNLETIQKHSLDSEKQQRLINMTLQETARLDFLTNNILVSSQLEGSGFHSEKEEMNLLLAVAQGSDREAGSELWLAGASASHGRSRGGKPALSFRAAGNRWQLPTERELTPCAPPRS